MATCILVYFYAGKSRPIAMLPGLLSPLFLFHPLLAGNMINCTVCLLHDRTYYELASIFYKKLTILTRSLIILLSSDCQIYPIMSLKTLDF
jgi:hypothetical protein